MLVLVKIVAGEKIALEVDSNDTIDDIKKKIQDKENIHSNYHQLFYADKELKSGTLSDHNITHGVTLHVVFSKKAVY